MLARLRELGVDVQRHLDVQTLQFPPEALDADDLVDWARTFFAEAESAQAPAVRWLEEGVWVKLTGISVPQFFELHARLNYLVKQYPSVVLCQYDIQNLEIPHLFSAIAVHRHLLVEGTLVRDNPFYIPAEKFLAMSPEDRERDLRDVFREVGFDLEKLLSTLAGYGRFNSRCRRGPEKMLSYPQRRTTALCAAAAGLLIWACAAWGPRRLPPLSVSPTPVRFEGTRLSSLPV